MIAISLTVEEAEVAARLLKSAEGLTVGPQRAVIKALRGRVEEALFDFDRAAATEG